jgi:hypothetical protein
MVILYSRATVLPRAPKELGLEGTLAPSALASEKGKYQRENDTQENRRRERKVKREIPAPDRDVARETPQRDADHDQQAEAGDCEADQNENPAH